MKLTMDGIKNREAWEKAGIAASGIRCERGFGKSEKRTKYGCTLESEIFSVYLSVELQMDLLEEGALDRGTYLRRNI